MSRNERRNRKISGDAEMTVELMHWWPFRESVPDGGSGSRKGSAADSLIDGTIKLTTVDEKNSMSNKATVKAKDTLTSYLV